jgi:hypothetical protein
VDLAAPAHTPTHTLSPPVRLFATVSQDIVGCDAVRVRVQVAETQAFTDAEDIVMTDAIPVADLVMGYQFPITHIPQNAGRYVRLMYDVIGAEATQGTVFAAFLAP